MKRYDPDRITDNLRALDAAAKPPCPSQETDPERSAPGTEFSPEAREEKASGGFPLPCFPKDLFYREILPAIQESVDIGSVPRGARLRFFKVLIQRFLRIISGKQVNFNRQALQSLQIWAEHARQTDEALALIAGGAARTDQTLVQLQDAIRQTNNTLADRIAQTNDAIGQVNDAAQQGIQAVWQQLAMLEERTVEQRRLQEQIQQLAERLSSEGEARMRRMLHLFVGELQGASASAGSGVAGESGGGAGLPSPSRAASLGEDYSYLLYEDAFRGSAEQIRAGQQEYAEWLCSRLAALPADKRRVLDAGCGRGEFLSLLRERGVEAVGVELNEVSAKIALEDGLRVEVGDVLDFLARQPQGSLGAVAAFQVVEHFPPALLRRFLDLVFAALTPGGLVVFETLNPGTFAAYRWYLMDPTHQVFLPPETLRFFCECAGFEHLETRMLHPVPDYCRLEPAGDDAQRENIRRLNELLFGPQDYCILARKPV